MRSVIVLLAMLLFLATTITPAASGQWVRTAEASISSGPVDSLAQ